MTDLTDMVGWLRSTVTGDLEKVKGEQHRNDSSDAYSCPASRTEPIGDLPYGQENCDCGLIARKRDTTARCEAELGIIDDYEQARRKLESGPDPRAPGSVFLSGRHDALRGAITRLVYGYRHRDGYKASWTGMSRL
jgi:hypothetical protein